MPDISGPFDSAPWSQDQWFRFAHTFAPSGVLGVKADAATPASGALGLTVNGLGISMAVGRAFVRGAGYERADTPWTATVAANLTGQPRIDALVLRRDLAARTVTPVLLTGTPAASPVAPTRKTEADGQWDLPLFTWRVAAGAAALTDLTDSRVWVDTETGYGFVSPGNTPEKPAVAVLVNGVTYWKTAEGVVTINGRVSSSGIIGTLPVGYRPASSAYGPAPTYLTASSASTGEATVDTAGVLTVTKASTGTTYFLITYVAA